MIPVDVMLLFIAASTALAVAPGPDNIFVLTQSALHGRKAGLYVTLGLCTGLLAHIAAVTVGVAALLNTSIIAFTMLKVAGAGYLLYLAWQAFKAGSTDVNAMTQSANKPALSSTALYLRGIVMNITNPKVAVFFLAFLPQFVDPSRGATAGQIIMLGVAFMSVTMIIFGAIAWASGYIGEWLRRSPKAQIAMNRISGVVFILLACRLALSERT